MLPIQYYLSTFVFRNKRLEAALLYIRGSVSYLYTKLEIFPISYLPMEVPPPPKCRDGSAISRKYRGGGAPTCFPPPPLPPAWKLIGRSDTCETHLQPEIKSCPYSLNIYWGGGRGL
jgi:hypothetical protein